MVGHLPTSFFSRSAWPELPDTFSGNAVQTDDSDKFAWEKASHPHSHFIFDIHLSRFLELWQPQYYFPMPWCLVGNGYVQDLRDNGDILLVNHLRGMGILHWLRNHSVMQSCWMMSRRGRKIYNCMNRKLGVWFVGLDVDS